MKINIVSLMLNVCLALSCAAAFTEPTSTEIEAVVDSPSDISVLLSGATPEDAVRVLGAFVQEVIKRDLPDEEIRIKIALAVAAIFRAMPDRAVELARLMAEQLPIEVLPAVAATAAVVMGNHAAVVTDAFLSKLSRENAQLIRNAGAHPELVLPPAVVLALGVPVSHATTALGRQPTAMPLAPPLTEVGVDQPSVASPMPEPEPEPVRRPPPPPIATNYAGQ